MGDRPRAGPNPSSSRRHRMREQAAVDAIGRLEQDRCVDERVENRLARDVVRAEAPPSFRYGHLQLGSREEFAFYAHQEILDPPAACQRPRVIAISHD